MFLDSDIVGFGIDNVDQKGFAGLGRAFCFDEIGGNCKFTLANIFGINVDDHSTQGKLVFHIEEILFSYEQFCVFVPVEVVLKAVGVRELFAVQYLGG